MDDSAKQTVSKQLQSDQDHVIEEIETCYAEEVVSDPEANALPFTTVALLELPLQFDNSKTDGFESIKRHKLVSVQDEYLLLERSGSELTKNGAQRKESRCHFEPFVNPPTGHLFGTCGRLHDLRKCLPRHTKTSTESTKCISGPRWSSPTSCQSGLSSTEFEPSSSRCEPSGISPRPCSSQCGPSRTEPELSSSQHGPTSNELELSSTQHGSTSNEPELYSSQHGPSSNEPGPSSNQPGLIDSLPQLTGSQTWRNKTRHRRSTSRPVSFINVPGSSCTQPLTISPSESGTSSGSSGSNLPIPEVVPISLPTESLCTADKSIIDHYNNMFHGLVNELWKYKGAAKGLKKFVLQSKLNYLRLSIQKVYYRDLQEQFSTFMSQMENYSIDMARITNETVHYMNLCMEIVSLLNEMDKSFSLPPLSPEFFYSEVKVRNNLHKLDLNMSILAT